VRRRAVLVHLAPKLPKKRSVLRSPQLYAPFDIFLENITKPLQAFVSIDFFRIKKLGHKLGKPFATTD
jgi:hypothetical protein